MIPDELLPKLMAWEIKIVEKCFSSATPKSTIAFDTDENILFEWVFNPVWGTSKAFIITEDEVKEKVFPRGIFDDKKWEIQDNK